MTNAVARLLRPAALLRLEGAVILVVAILWYWQLGASWLLFALLLLFPDLGALGYLAGGRLGAACYNATHTLGVPTVLLLSGLQSGSLLAPAIATIWFAHIGMDRLVGYGFKEAPSTEPDAPRAATLGFPVMR